MKVDRSRLFDIKIILIICLIFSFRMFCSFIILPLFSNHDLYFIDENGFLIGLAVGSYSFSQAIFQIPMSIVSDKIGRKPIIILSFLLFFLGSCIMSIHLSIWTIIFGRILQGSGATSSVITSLLFDLIKKENRSVGMMCIGITFLLTFSFSVILGPALVKNIGINIFFWLVSIFSLICMLIVSFYVPEKKRYNCIKLTDYNKNIFSDEIRNLFSVLKDWTFLKLNVSAFIFNFILMSNFFIFPKKFIEMGFLVNTHWIIYVTVLFASLVISYFLMRFIEQKNYMYNAWYLCIFFIFLSQVILLFSCNNSTIFFSGMVVFFVVYYLSSSFLPVLIRNFSLNSHEGMAIGVLNTFQFLGTSAGGTLSGYVQNKLCLDVVFITGLLSSLTLYIYIYVHELINKKN